MKGFQQEFEGERWSAPIEEFDETAKNAVLPDSFPDDMFQLSPTDQIDDTGQYSDSSWFIVFRSTSVSEANSRVKDLLSVNSLAVQTQEDTADGGIVGVAENAELSVDFLTLHEETAGALISIVVTLQND